MKVIIGLNILVINNLIFFNFIFKQLVLFTPGFYSNDLDYIGYI